MSEAVDSWAAVIGIVFLFPSVVAVFSMLRYLSKVPEEKTFMPPPEPRKTFG